MCHPPRPNRRPARAALACFAVAAALTACEPDLTDAAFPDQRTDAVGETSDLGGGAGDSAASDGAAGSVETALEGTWGVVTDMSLCGRLILGGIAGTPFEIRTFVIALSTFEQDGPWVRESRRICRRVSTPVVGFETNVPDETNELDSPLVATGALYPVDPDDPDNPVPGGDLRYKSGIFLEVWGLNMDDPWLDPLPAFKDADDERIFDHDGDGKPGVTLTLGDNDCEMYVVQRAKRQTDVVRTGPFTFEGGGMLNSKQTVVAGEGICGQQYTTAPNQSLGDENGENSAENTTRMVRVDPGGLNFDTNGDGEVSCDELVARSVEILSPRDANNARCN
jgi:hypothetical protein